jgi:Na+/H+ antiporter NhaD/arsenite permease-like protein
MLTRALLALKETAALARKPMTVNLGETAQKVDVNELERKYIITDRPLFYKCVAVLAGVISLFFLNSFVDTHLSLAWIALIGTMTLLVLANVKDINVVLEKVELGTLLFFAGLFVLMKSLEELEVMAFIANHTASLIAHVPEGNTHATHTPHTRHTHGTHTTHTLIRNTVSSCC